MSGQADAPSVSLGQRFRSWQTALAFITLAGVIYLLLTRFDVAWSDTWDLMRGMNPLWYLAAIVIHYTTFYFRGARWRMLLENSARRDGLPFERRSALYYGRIILISWFANSVTFFRVGDAYRAYAYSEDTKSSFPRAVGSVLADRVIDLSVVGSLMGVGIVVLLLTGDVDPPLILVVAAVGLLGAIVAGLLSMLVLRRWIIPLLPQQLASVYDRFHDGTMGSFARLDRVYALGVLGWLMEVGRLFFVIKALGLSVAAGLLIFVPMANGVLSAIPLTPGGLGVVETGVSGLLHLDIALELAVAVALLDRTISYLSIIVTGGIAFAVRQFSTRPALTLR
ncbi:MAG: lysylphosphatidylglycerol synthase transmembrane domain-containing protein [Chloroflexi bacterium]|nr:lysylphosphatidylglycerol synthase transmembrane domain-containing protein [Chloroflexota bacterium]